MTYKLPARFIPIQLFRTLGFPVALLLSLSGKAQLITLEASRVSAERLFSTIEKQSRYVFFYSIETVRQVPCIDIYCRNVPVQKVLDNFLPLLHLRYAIQQDVIFIYGEQRPAVKPLKGRVLGPDGDPLAGVCIDAGGDSIKHSGIDGSFCIKVTRPLTRVSFTSFGYHPQTLQLSNARLQTVRLQPVIEQLDSVFVGVSGYTGFNRIPTGSVTEVSRDSGFERRVWGELARTLEGRVPGLYIRQYNGVPGSAADILIRGRHSITQGTQPLIVVDGIPLTINDGSLGAIGFGSAQGYSGASLMNGIPTSAIERVEVLKSPAAMSAYGTPGAGGVILITLKNNVKGRHGLTIDLSSGIDRVVSTPPLLSTRQFISLRKEAIQNDGLPISASTFPEYLLLDTSRNTDFKRWVTGNTRLRQHVSISSTGGNAQTAYLSSSDYMRSSSLFPGSTSDSRVSLYGRLDHHSLDNRLQWATSSLVSEEINHLPIEDYSYSMFLAPNAPPFHDNGGRPAWNYKGVSFVNIPSLNKNTYESNVLNLLTYIRTSYRVWPELKVSGYTGYLGGRSIENSIQRIAGQLPTPGATAGRWSTGKGRESWLLNGMIEYTPKIFRGELTVYAGIRRLGQHTRYYSDNATGYVSDVSLATGSAAPVSTHDAGSFDYRDEALFGGAHYSLDQKYFVSFSTSRESSSRLPAGQSFNDFWSWQGAWAFRNERFFRRLTWLNLGKVRASIGTTGNDQAAMLMPDVSGSPARAYQGLQGPHIPSSNPGLPWEINYRSEVGLDLGFLQNKIQLSATAYRDWTSNQLIYDQPVISYDLRNVRASVVNKGLELSLQTVNLRSHRFEWISTLTVTVPSNRLKSLEGFTTSPYAARLTVGRSLSTVKGYHYEGVDPNVGLFRFRDVNHDGILDGRDWLSGGDLDPRIYGGLNQLLRYGNWQIELFIEFRRQNGLNPYAILYAMNPPGSVAAGMVSNGPRGWLDHWRQPGDHALLQRLTTRTTGPDLQAIQQYVSSDARLTDASFLRWKSLSISYRLSDRFLSSVHIRDGVIYLKGHNLFTLTSFPVADPETQSPFVLPPSRTLEAGMRICF